MNWWAGGTGDVTTRLPLTGRNVISRRPRWLPEHFSALCPPISLPLNLSSTTRHVSLCDRHQSFISVGNWHLVGGYPQVCAPISRVFFVSGVD